MTAIAACEHCGTLLEVSRYDVPPTLEAALDGVFHSTTRCRDILKSQLAAASLLVGTYESANERYKRALEWYADEDNYFETVDRDAPGRLIHAGTIEEVVLPDRGDRARDALAGKST